MSESTPKRHRFQTITKGGKKGKRGGMKSVRMGARHPGGTTQGSIRRPF